MAIVSFLKHDDESFEKKSFKEVKIEENVV